MRDDVRQKDGARFIFPAYIVAHVLACGLGVFFGHYLFDKPILGNWVIDFLVLPLLYVVLFFVNALVARGLEIVFEFFKKLNLFNIFRRLNEFLFAFLSYLVLFASFLFLVFWLSGWDSEILFNLGTYVLIYFILPLGVSLFALYLIGRAMGYSFRPEDKQKTMVQGSQSETTSSTSHKEFTQKSP